jgi:SAM-dependent methyltransferase
VFKNPEESHEHSLDVLNMLYQYDSFLDSLEVIADMGCGSGLDAQWWAQLTTRDDPPEPHDYIVYAVDKDISKIDDAILKQNHRILTFQNDFNVVALPRQVDLMWSHDSFQFSTNPLATLRHWNSLMNENGMLVLNVPMQTTYSYDRLQTRSFSGTYFTYNICNLTYMLAVNGFDCRDCYIYMAPNYGWIHFAVYKSRVPFDHETTSLFDVADAGLLSDSAMSSLNKYGHLRQEELMFTWLDKDWRFAKN